MHKKSATLFLSILILGCASQKPMTRSSELVRTISVKGLQDAIILNTSKIQTLKSKITIQISSPNLPHPVRLNGILRFKRPNMVRLVASKLTFTMFDMIYNGSRFWFYIPQEDKVYSGIFNDNAIINVLGALFKPHDIINIFNYKGLFEEKVASLATGERHWVIHIMGKLSQRHLFCNIYIEKDNLNVTRCEFFDNDVNLQTLISMDNYLAINGCNVPRMIKIEWLPIKSAIVLNLDGVEVNQELSDIIFDFSIPERSEIVPIDILQ